MSIGPSPLERSSDSACRKPVGAHHVRVHDRAPAKLVAAAQLGFNVSARSASELVSQCNLIIVAADTMPIRSDDSLGLDQLLDRGVLTPRAGGYSEKVTQYLTGDGKVVNLIYHGEAPNMRSRIGVDDPTIFMPSVLHALAGLEFARGGSWRPTSRRSATPRSCSRWRSVPDPARHARPGAAHSARAPGA